MRDDQTLSFEQQISAGLHSQENYYSVIKHQPSLQV